MKRPGAPRDEPVTQADRDYHANRSRGLGGNPTTGAEENLLGYPGTRYWGEHIFVHEFAHAIMTADPRRRSGDARRDPSRVRQPRWQPASTCIPTVANTTRRRTPASTGPKVCSGGSSRTTASASRGNVEGGDAGRVRRVRSEAERADQPRVRDTSHSDGCLPCEAHPAGDMPACLSLLRAR